MKNFYTILLLFCSNTIMCIAWYGNLKFKNFEIFENKTLPFYIFISWLIAFAEYCFMIPANMIGYKENGGNFNLFQLKIIQEAVSIIVFTLFTVLVFKNETLKINHLIGFAFLIISVYFFFKK